MIIQTQMEGAPEKKALALDRAFEIGIAASPDTAQPGHEYGIWGRAMNEAGLEVSAGMLMRVAEVCGGLVMNLHLQGLGSSCIALSGILDEPVNHVACSVQEESGLPGAMWPSAGRGGCDHRQPACGFVDCLK